ncbi:MAG: Re/Si-specific NAD(P)(+) transhydrogenase subunit alpha [Mariprofundales bacterium]
MLLAIPAESFAGEKRVAIVPEIVKKYIAKGMRVRVQSAAGVAASFTDAVYETAGASIAPDFASCVAEADIIIKVAPPNTEELSSLPTASILIAMLDPLGNPDLQLYADNGLRAFALEKIPRISRAQSMDVLSSQANLAGYRAVLLASQYYQRFFPMLMTAAGTVSPARVLVLGAGVAGLQAIATARRLGAIVEAFDVRTAAKEQVESLGASFVEVAADEQGEDAGGYAKEMSDDYKKQQQELLHKHASKADIIITTALIPGRTAPQLITEAMLQDMKTGSVVVDMAVIRGGNCFGAKLDEVVDLYGVCIIGESNIPSLLATDASRLYARNIFNFLSLMLQKDEAGKTKLHIDLDDEIITQTLICDNGIMR